MKLLQLLYLLSLFWVTTAQQFDMFECTNCTADFCMYCETQAFASDIWECDCSTFAFNPDRECYDSVRECTSDAPGGGGIDGAMLLVGWATTFLWRGVLY